MGNGLPVRPSTFNDEASTTQKLREYKAVFVIGDQEASHFTHEITVNRAPLVLSAPRRVHMSWAWKAIKGLIDHRAAGESVIEGTEANYRGFQRMNPSLEPHQILSLVYLARMRPRGKNPKSEAMQAEAHAITLEYSCLPFPISARALAIDFVRLELPHVIRQCPDFEVMHSEYMRPVREARQSGECDELYRRYNPGMAEAQRLQDEVGKETADKILGHMSKMDDQEQEKFVRDFKEHMEKSARKAASMPLTMPSRRVGLPPDGLYIHLNGEAKGPFTVEQLKALFVVEAITKDTPCCLNGAEAWQTVGAYVEVSG